MSRASPDAMKAVSPLPLGLTQGVLELAGRCLLSTLFVVEGWSKLESYPRALAYLDAFGMPSWLLPAAIALEIGAGLLIYLGWQTRPAAAGLALFCLAAAVTFHRNWADRNQLLHFEKDVALAGAFLILAARGAGPLSIDRRVRGGSRQALAA